MSLLHRSRPRVPSFSFLSVSLSLLASVGERVHVFVHVYMRSFICVCVYALAHEYMDACVCAFGF